MRRTLGLVLGASAGLLFVACGTDGNVITGTRSDGVTVRCSGGQYLDYYQCTPNPGGVAPGANAGDGSGSGMGSGSGGGECVPWPNGPADVLWPPNHKMLTFSLQDCANLSACPQGQTAAIDGSITKITVDEPVDVGQGGDGYTPKYDVRILDAQHFELRSERQGGGDGRVYTVYYQDSAGNTGSCQYLVPHNQGPFEGAVDSGTAYTVTP